MANSEKASASTWRKRDAAYRKQEKERRAANTARRAAREQNSEAVKND